MPSGDYEQREEDDDSWTNPAAPISTLTTNRRVPDPPCWRHKGWGTQGTSVGPPGNRQE